jgi:hypothetical protein
MYRAISPREITRTFNFDRKEDAPWGTDRTSFAGDGESPPRQVKEFPLTWAYSDFVDARELASKVVVGADTIWPFCAVSAKSGSASLARSA